MSLTNRILIAMVAGIVTGSVINLIMHSAGIGDGIKQIIDGYLVGGLFDVIGRIFVASLKLLVVPLVLVSLICGSSSLGDSARMGPIAVKTLGFYLATTAIAITLALVFAALISPGSGVEMAGAAAFEPRPAPPLGDVLVDIFPSNPVRAMADGKMLQIIVFALLFGYAISHAGEPGRRMASFFRDMDAIIMKMVEILMTLAPYGVFALLSKLFSNLGISAILDLATYVFTVIGVLLLHALGVYTLLLKSMTGLSPRMLLKKMRPIWAFAFSTASSGATLPITLRTVEKRLGVHNSVAGFTVPLGATINMDGTAIMQGVATVFIAQVYGVDLSMGDFITVILTATLASIGTAAVPGVGLITLALVLEQAGLPVEGIALIIGVDRLLDMVRTAVNVTGDATISVIVGKSENQFEQGVYDDPKADQEADDAAVPARA
ncbi:dicarboxylate/amino acid:cation symporter [Halioglobus japonicus]|uniref:Dicarboxylate/amino acid:cation symporter n=1 Tax=Halioglobus japonicus TaxID=930805 RepID=A0AAP8MBQ4_9GAMM|nr:dicarboxylate/amino acid:cation symporter [Halioglobus japonicus]AQA16979.1 dicarboxylate/amino acid:cation symporter [Halioglobus japonicus]PLW84866.1 dicarboxylate/amino acid:cation symporter [Halioglobus japonicus]GHD21850.1 proton/glutamate symporter [Halioglobus japonicus]